jgi:xylulokinase
MPTFLLGIDVSTTATKALLIDEQGAVVAVAATEYSFETPQPLWSEQDPALFWSGAVQSVCQVIEISGVSPGDIVAVGLTGQMHGLTLLDAHGETLRPCILWNDQRTAKQCAEISRRVGQERVLQLTGNPVLTGFTAPKILWVQQNEPEVFRRVAHILLPKDYVRYKLTGGFFSDVSDSSGTSLFDVGKRVWSDEMLRALDIPRTRLPEVTESPVVSAKINAEAARATRLLEGTPVVGGGGDQAAQAVGTGIVREGIVSVTVGTSGVVFAQSDSYRVEPQGRLHAFCHAVPGKWHLMGVTLSAGGSLRWYRDALGETEKQVAARTGQDVYDVLMAQATQAPAGCEGLLFLPYLTGERTPHPNPNARGVFFGLTVRHNKSHLIRAVLEGVSFGLRDSLELMRVLGVPLAQVRASGGGARSALWRQILADVFDAEIATVNVTEGAAYGAALLAGVGVGVYRDVESACEVVRITGRTQPGTARTVYADYYPRYRALYPALKPEFEAMAQLAVGGRLE